MAPLDSSDARPVQSADDFERLLHEAEGRAGPHRHAPPRVLGQANGRLPCAARDRDVPRLGRHPDEARRRRAVCDPLRSPPARVGLVAAQSRDRPPVGPRGSDDGRRPEDAAAGPMTGRRPRRAPGGPGRGRTGRARRRAGTSCRSSPVRAPGRARRAGGPRPLAAPTGRGSPRGVPRRSPAAGRVVLVCLEPATRRLVIADDVGLVLGQDPADAGRYHQSPSTMSPMHSSADHSPGAGQVRRRSPASTMSARIAAKVLGLRYGRINVAERGKQRRPIRLRARAGRVAGSFVLPHRLTRGHPSSRGSRRARSRSAPSASAIRQTQAPPSGHASASRCDAGSAARAYSSRTRRGRRGRLVPARGQHRLVEPVGIDRVVDVVHRVELLRPDRELGAGGRRWDLAEIHAGQAEGGRRRPEDGVELLRDAVGVPRSSRRTQSIWTHDTSEPSASWNSVRRRAQTRRQPTTRVVPTNSVPTAIGATTATSAARTSQVIPRSAYHDRSNPRLEEC